MDAAFTLSYDLSLSANLFGCLYAVYGTEMLTLLCVTLLKTIICFGGNSESFYISHISKDNIGKVG